MKDDQGMQRDPLETRETMQRLQGTRIVAEGRVLFAFAALTILMTWPWAAMIRDGVTDPGDPYLNSWILWWDWHATFTNPLGLFHGNLMFPYQYSLAWSEHNYGIALLLFPLFFLGAAPLTVHGIATLLGFLLSGYGAFRLARTLTGSDAAAWVAGIAFAFVPYRFHLLPHVNYVFSGWMPLLFEALVLFARRPSRMRAAWLGLAFLMNGLTCIHWFVLSAVPFVLIGLIAALREGVERSRDFWIRGAVALGIALVLLLPFLVPYRIVANLYGFERSAGETLAYSARPEHWLTADPGNRLWRGLGVDPPPGELALFPGLLPLLLALAAFFLPGTPRTGAGPEVVAFPLPGSPRRRRVLAALDATSVVAGSIALLASSPSGLVFRHAGEVVFSASRPTRALTVLVVVLLVRWTIAWPTAFASRGRNLPESLRRSRRPAAMQIGMALVACGVLGSFGLRFPFHSILFEVLSPFRSIRVPARWAMIADLGLALLAGLGAIALSAAVRRRWPSREFLPGTVIVAACALLLLEQRAAPLGLVHGQPDPDEATRFLGKTSMAGGIVELPTTYPVPYEAMLRAADHGKPLVNGISGFVPPTVEKLEKLLDERPIPESLLDHLESIPTAYLVVHESRLTDEDRQPLQAVLSRGLATGRLRFVGRFDGRRKNDVYVVTKTEPGVGGASFAPWDLGAFLGGSGPSKETNGLPGSIDDPAQDVTVHGRLLVRGWAREEGGDLDVAILLDGELRKPDAFRRVPRPDVARALPRLGDCGTAGYEAEFDFQKGDEGRREIRVVFRAADGRYRYYPLRTIRWAN